MRLKIFSHGKFQNLTEIATKTTFLLVFNLVKSFESRIYIEAKFNRGGEAELDADPVVVVVLVLSDLGSRDSNTHLGLRSNNRPRQ